MNKLERAQHQAIYLLENGASGTEMDKLAYVQEATQAMLKNPKLTEETIEREGESALKVVDKIRQKIIGRLN